MKKLSVIIPIYNAEKYISKCITSVLNQDLNEEDYEIIIVDDESPDNSILIINDFLVRYNNIKLFSQKNKGLGGARNTGIVNAKGEYLLFLDADDYLKDNVLTVILTLAIENKLDILEFGAIGITENNKIIYTKSLESKRILDGFSYLNEYQYMNSACNKLYQTDFLKINRLFFEERIFIEDFEFNTRVFYYAQKVKAVKNLVSNFVQSPNSITRNFDVNKNLKMVKDIEEVIYKTIEFKNMISLTIMQKKVIDERIAFLTTTLLYKMLVFLIDNIKVKSILDKLENEELYPFEFRVNDMKKNIFKYVSNNSFVYFTILKIYRVINHR